jgi:hypothetical protein
MEVRGGFTVGAGSAVAVGTASRRALYRFSGEAA